MRGGLPTSRTEIAERLLNTPDLVLGSTLEREIESEQKLRSRLEFVQLRIRLIREEQARRAGLIPASVYDHQ